MALYRNIVVIGASAGGPEALRQLVGQLPIGFPATVCIVNHLGTDANNHMVRMLAHVSALPVSQAEDGEALQAGRIYLAAPCVHMLLDDGRIILRRGPHENLARPAIDALFRSAAASHSSQVIGVLLSGLLDDGTAGMLAIRRSGGIAIAQDPADATFPDMPRSAIEHGAADYAVPLSEIGALLNQLVRVPLAELSKAPEDVVLEARISARVQSDVRTDERIGELSALSCPECGGPLWQIHDSIIRFRCHVGHGFTATMLLESQDTAVEHALWVALRTLEERLRLLSRMAESSGAAYQHLAHQNDRIHDLQQAILTLRELLKIQLGRQPDQPAQIAPIVPALPALVTDNGHTKP